MIFFCDKYTDNAEKLKKTMNCLGLDIKIVVLEEDGFLPPEVLSPYEYFAYHQSQDTLIEKELFYDFLKVPDFWEIRSTGFNGGIYDMGMEKASIYFTEPHEKRNVQRVEWRMENGWIYRIDFYNKYGLKSASEFLDTNGNIESKVFYSAKNQEVIVVQPQSSVITLLEKGKVKAYFASHNQFINYYTKEAGIEQERVLFIQDEKQFDLLEYMDNEKSLWKAVLFSNNELLNKYVNKGGKDGYRFYEIPENYPVNYARGEALILTASDQIEKIEYLVSELPDMIFHIAANTQVSDKLYKLAERNNVEVYPQISANDLNILWDVCDFYLDINHYREIHDAVNIAHQKNLIIMGFENTLHHKELVVKECVFSVQDYKKFILVIHHLIDNSELVKNLLIVQQSKKDKIWNKFLELTEE